MSLEVGLSMRRAFRTAVGLLLLLAAQRELAAQSGYQHAPRAVEEVLNAPSTPRASVGRTHDIVLLYSPVLYPPIGELSQRFERLARGVTFQPPGAQSGCRRQRDALGRSGRVSRWAAVLVARGPYDRLYPR